MGLILLWSELNCKSGTGKLESDDRSVAAARTRTTSFTNWRDLERLGTQRSVLCRERQRKKEATTPHSAVADEGRSTPFWSKSLEMYLRNTQACCWSFISPDPFVVSRY